MTFRWEVFEILCLDGVPRLEPGQLRAISSQLDLLRHIRWNCLTPTAEWVELAHLQLGLRQALRTQALQMGQMPKAMTMAPFRLCGSYALTHR